MNSQGGKPQSGSRLYVGGLSLTATQKDVEDLFGHHGKVTEVRMNRNFAFVQFSDDKEAAEAMEAIGGQVHFGRKLDVQYARAPRNQNQGDKGDDGGRDRSPMRDRGGSGGMRGGMRGGSGSGGGNRNFGGSGAGGHRSGPSPFGNDSWNDDFKGGFGGGGPGAGGGGGPGDFRGGGGGGSSCQDFFGRGGNNDGPFGGSRGGGGPGGMNDYGRDGFGGGRGGGRDGGNNLMDNRSRGGSRFSGGNDFRDSPPFRGGPDGGMGGSVGPGSGLDLGAPYRNQGGMGGGRMSMGGLGGSGNMDMGGGGYRGGMDTQSGPKQQLSPWQKDLPPTQTPVSLNTSNNDRTNDIEIIVVHKSITPHAFVFTQSRKESEKLATILQRRKLKNKIIYTKTDKQLEKD